MTNAELHSNNRVLSFSLTLLAVPEMGHARLNPNLAFQSVECPGKARAESLKDARHDVISL